MHKNGEMSFSGSIGPLRFLYVGVADTSAAIDHYCDAFGGRLRWRFDAFDSDVAAVEFGTVEDGSAPLVMLADHRPPGTILPIYVIDDLDAAVENWRRDGYHVEGPAGTPEGPVALVRDGNGVELAFLQLDRPGALDGAWNDKSNTHRVQED